LLKIIHPTFTIKQPSNGKILNFRRYVVKEDKILLFAKESKDLNDILKAVKDVVNVCCMEEDFNVNEIPLFDLEYIFLKLRGASVNNYEEFVVRDVQDNKEYKLAIDFDDIEVKFKEDAPSKNIQVDDNITIVMRYPKASIYDDKEFKERLVAQGGLFELVLDCIEQIYNKDEVVEMTRKELAEFLETVGVPAFRKMEAFLVSMPSIKHTIHYINSLGNPRQLTFNSLIDFFLYL